jgi:hypothetical protein
LTGGSLENADLLVGGHVHRTGARHVAEHLLRELCVFGYADQERVGRRPDSGPRQGWEDVCEGQRQSEALSNRRRLVRGCDVPPVADTANDAAAGEKGFASLDGAGWHDDDGA